MSESEGEGESAGRRVGHAPTRGTSPCRPRRWSGGGYRGRLLLSNGAPADEQVIRAGREEVAHVLADVLLQVREHTLDLARLVALAVVHDRRGKRGTHRTYGAAQLEHLADGGVEVEDQVDDGLQIRNGDAASHERDERGGDGPSGSSAPQENAE